jgi:hypothetical protein
VLTVRRLITEPKGVCSTCVHRTLALFQKQMHARPAYHLRTRTTCFAQSEFRKSPVQRAPDFAGLRAAGEAQIELPRVRFWQLPWVRPKRGYRIGTFARCSKIKVRFARSKCCICGAGCTNQRNRSMNEMAGLAVASPSCGTHGWLRAETLLALSS